MSDLITTIHNKALQAAAEFKKAEIQLLAILIELDKKRIYRHFKRTSLYDYCLHELKLSENVSVTYIQVARKMAQIPELKDAVNQQLVTINKAKRIVPVITKENATEWIKKASTLSCRSLEQEVCGLAPETLALERIKYIANRKVELKIILTVREYNRLERARDILSNKLKKAASLSETIAETSQQYYLSHDPWEKAMRAMRRDSAKQQISQSNLPFARKVNEEIDPIPTESNALSTTQVFHQVVVRDQNQCSFIYPDGKRCQNTRWLHLHHEQHKEHGGQDTVENCRLYCSSHHQIAHAEQWVDV